MANDFVDTVIGVVANADIASVNTDAASWDPNAGGANTLGDKLGLSSDGNTPSTHDWFCSKVTSSMLSSMETSASTYGWNLYKVSDGNTSSSVLTAEGLQVIMPS